MILKFNGQYLDFNADVDIEKKVKLFEEIDSADGDVSYEFQITLTSENLAILGPILPDSSDKVVYSQNDCEVLNDEGSLINRGSLRIERIIGGVAYCSFLGGNSNWFAQLSGNMTELRLSQYDKDITEANITASWNEDSGIVFPLLDAGVLIDRSYQHTKTEDFIGCFYLKTLVKEVFIQSGIKIQGELLEDWIYNNAVIVSNTRSIEDKNKNSFYVATEVSQFTGNSIGGDALTEFELQTGNDPYYLGELITVVDNNKFYMNVDMVVNIDSTVDYFSSTFTIMYLYINGVAVTSITDMVRGDLLLKNIRLNTGDYISIATNTGTVFTNSFSSASLRLTPLFIYKSYGSSTVPFLTKQQFISNVFSVFNVLPNYDHINKTLTLNLFDKIKEKEPIDISEFIEINEIDYSEFISNYGKVNNFEYSEGSDEDIKQYNIESFIKYAAGEINCDNDFIDDKADVVSLDFKSPISYLHPVFNASIERVEFIELIDDGDAQAITSVSDASGVAQLNITNADQFFEDNDLVTIDCEQYSGDFVISDVASSYIKVWGLDYGGSSTGTVQKKIHKFTNDDSIYLMVKTQYERVRDMSKSITGVYVNQGFRTFASLAYFNILRNTAAFEETYKQSLSFGSVNNPLSFQKTLLDKYWKQFERILNDPVMLKVTGNLPLTVYNRLDFLHPVTIRTKESSNMYYVNRISAYKNSYTPCELELIKLP